MQCHPHLTELRNQYLKIAEVEEAFATSHLRVTTRLNFGPYSKGKLEWISVWVMSVRCVCRPNNEFNEFKTLKDTSTRRLYCTDGLLTSCN
jgi:hypothetical protein